MVTLAELKKLVQENELLKKELDKMVRENTHHLRTIEVLEEEIRVLHQRFFAKRSEKWPEDEQKQAYLFDEAEIAASEQEPNSFEESSTEQKKPRIKKSGRKPLPESLVREEIIHDIDEAQKVCSCGCKKTVIGQEVSEKLEIIPAQLKVQRHIRLKYGCSSCKDETKGPTVIVAPTPPQILPKTMATPGLLAYVIASKYADGIPLNRQERLFGRIGIQLPRETLGRWVMSVATKVEPLIDVFTQNIKNYPAVLMDETTLQVMNEIGKENTTTSYMWVARGGPPDSPVVRFSYSPSRGSSVAEKLLENYRGFVQTDGYAGYDKPCSVQGITHVTCFAHARRKFYEAQKASKKSAQALEALSYIKKLYKAETQARAASFSQKDFVEKRKALVQPVFEAFYQWLLKKEQTVLSSSALGKAIAYTLGQWEKLIRYVDSPDLTPDTNRVENAIRPFVVGRKNWMVQGSPRGAFASAVLYSIIETAKANNLEPYWYLRHLLEAVEQNLDNPDWEALAPWNLTKEQIRQP